jgi:CBS domain containing-hemolysin-like protein
MNRRRPALTETERAALKYAAIIQRRQRESAGNSPILLSVPAFNDIASAASAVDMHNARRSFATRCVMRALKVARMRPTDTASVSIWTCIAALLIAAVIYVLFPELLPRIAAVLSAKLQPVATTPALSAAARAL